VVIGAALYFVLCPPIDPKYPVKSSMSQCARETVVKRSLPRPSDQDRLDGVILILVPCAADDLLPMVPFVTQREFDDVCLAHLLHTNKQIISYVMIKYVGDNTCALP
jgi:hypothetical protein